MRVWILLVMLLAVSFSPVVELSNPTVLFSTNPDDLDNDGILNQFEDINGDGDLTNDDTDGDGTPNYLDIDDDGDGWATWFECPAGINSEEDECPGFAPAYDYLQPELFNCEVPIIGLAHIVPTRQLEFAAYFSHNDSLVTIAMIDDNSTAGLARSFENGGMYWVNTKGGISNRALSLWTPDDGAINVGLTGSSNGYSRSTNLLNGSIVSQKNDDIYIHNETGVASLLANIANSGGGGDIVTMPNGDLLMVMSNSSLMMIEDDMTSTRYIGRMWDLGFGGGVPKGAVINGSDLIWNSGKELFSLSGNWTEGFDSDGLTPDGDQVNLTKIYSDADSTTGGDMANCVIPSQDTDGEGIPDFYEEKIFGTDSANPDSDGDGLNDFEEVVTYPTDPLDPDSDDDGLNDGAEVNTYFTNPLNPDSDGDWCQDGAEVNQHQTDPNDADTDDDGLGDCAEVGFNTDPNDADSDNDGLGDGVEINDSETDPLDSDSDDDNLSDGDEVNNYSSNPNMKDTDQDGCEDGDEVLIHGTNPLIIDTNGDGVVDCATPTSVIYPEWMWVLYLNETISNATPIISGDAPTSWLIEPSLPEGMTLQNGAINGSSPARWQMQNHTISWSGPGGIGSKNVVLVIMERGPVISYPQSSYSLKVGEPFSIDVTNTGGSAIQWSLNDSLPPGLELIDGNIAGTPLQSSELIHLEIRAYGPDEFGYTLLTIEVEPSEQVIEKEKPAMNELFPGLLLELLVPCMIIFAALLLLSILWINDDEVELEEE